METKCDRDLHKYLSTFKPGYPILNGYIAQRLLYGSITDVIQVVEIIVQETDTRKHVNRNSLRSQLHQLLSVTKTKKCYSTVEWQSLMELFIKPFDVPFIFIPPIRSQHAQAASLSSSTKSESFDGPFGRLTPASSKPIRKQTASSSLSLPSSERLIHTSTPTSLQSAPGTSQTTTFTQPNQTSLSINELFLPGSLALPTNPESQCPGCVTWQDINANISLENNDMSKQLRELKKQVAGEKKATPKRLKKAVTGKIKSVQTWERKFLALKADSEKTQEKLGLLQESQLKVGKLENELHVIMKGNTEMKELIKHLKRELKEVQSSYSCLESEHNDLMGKVTIPKQRVQRKRKPHNKVLCA